MLRQITARWVVVGIALLAPVSLAFVGIRTEPSGRKIVVPNVLNTRLEDAFMRLRKVRLRVRIPQTFESPPNSGMVVLSQEPDPGTRVRVGSAVTLRVGGGS
jgi:beta-lactam-binding protein with PASTA domain